MFLEIIIYVYRERSRSSEAKNRAIESRNQNHLIPHQPHHMYQKFHIDNRAHYSPWLITFISWLAVSDNRLDREVAAQGFGV